MQEGPKILFAKAAFFYIAVILLTTFFLITFIEGITTNLNRNTSKSAIYFFVAVVSIALSILFILRGNKFLKEAKYLSI